jgi:hypothetical protein
MNKIHAQRRFLGIASGIRGFSGGGGGAGTVTQHNGRVLANALIKPVFWGSQWFHAQTPAAGEILWAIRSLLMGPYMSGLAQYGVGKATLDPNPVFTGFAPDPPQNFTRADIENMLKTFIDSGQLPGPSTNPQALLCVFTPLDIVSDQADDNGFHQVLNHGGNVPYTWVRNLGDLAFLTSVFSHELAEATTDPFLDAVFGDDGSCDQDGRCEIGDYCYGPTAGRGSGSLGG